MALHIHRAERAETLVTELSALLAIPLPDPFAAEVVAVPVKGMERWLVQQLSGVLGVGPDTLDGVCANIACPTPSALVADVLATASEVPAAADPWGVERLTWPVLRALDAALDEPWAAVPARHLGHGDASSVRVGRRLATATRIATLFDGYAAQRPTLITDWAAGRDTDGYGAALPEDLRWQPELWRRVRAELGVASPAERLPAAVARLRAEPGCVALPQRISLFAPTRLPDDQLAVLTALAEHRDVHVWLVHSTPALWTALGSAPIDGADVLAGQDIPVLRSADHSARLVAHPLLAALGRDARELRLRLPVRPSVPDRHYPSAASDSATLLSRLQAGLRDDSWPPAAPAPDDGTVTVHACHGAARQVEVLREILLGLLAADPTLQPRDVVVLCPDVERYGPLVRAAFGQWQSGQWTGDDELPHPAHGLRVRPADRSPGAVNPVLAVLEQLFALADGRVEVTAVLDLAAADPVRLRCGFGDDDLERLREWSAETGARWGIGQRQRQAYGLGDFAQNTLNAAVDRILLGVAAGESSEDWLELALPLDDVDSGDVDLAGRLAEFVDRLAVCLRDLGGPVPGAPAGTPRPATEWLRVLERALDLLTEVPRGQQWQAAQARTELAAALEPAGTQMLRLPDIAALLRGRLAAQAGRANFRTGELSVCGPAPLRSVPHRVVVLLGLDDEVFPRATGIDGDDVMSRAPRIGERDARSEDRQLLLDAIMAARDKLVLLYTGADPVTGAPRPPAVPVAELLDVLRELTGPVAADTAHPLATVHTRHPLQAFDSRNFDPVRPFGFDPLALAGARAAAHPPQPAAPFLSQPLAAPVIEDVELADLIAFAEHPVRAFLWQRLGIRVPEEDDEVDDRLPIELDGLTRWNIGERMLAARLTGTAPEVLRAAEWRRGTLPPFGLGAAVLEDVEYTVDRLVRVARPIHELPAHTLDIAVDLGGGRRLTGTVADIRDDAVVRATFSRLAPKHRMAAWIRVLALAAAHRHQSWRAVTIGRGKFGRPAGRSTVVPPNGAGALVILRDLAELRDEGLTAPLPITPTASALYADRRCAGADLADARLAADQEFLGGPNGPKAFGDHTDRCLRYVWGPMTGLDTIDTPLPAPDRSGETTRFGACARRLWSPLLAAENQDQP
ncbi:exodeoxyribonuclease V subunit gamma [Nocardia stercoris]|uniref:RecBCD enzyme subunit RecC n=1 Tax=Nocardia stercoris TaxID=2483361 RepID=A0A3M2L3W4_9NOCA|nr:exodeoxyribonuclease V subunit gamma [Nocardia stercoris]RMI32241.1 exodeoxyribonuclease V subunit gamma [Nocardia stercoris]